MVRGHGPTAGWDLLRSVATAIGGLSYASSLPVAGRGTRLEAGSGVVSFVFQGDGLRVSALFTERGRARVRLWPGGPGWLTAPAAGAGQRSVARMVQSTDPCVGETIKEVRM